MGTAQVPVQVKAAGINPGEAKIRVGLEDSSWPEIEAAGIFTEGTGRDSPEVAAIARATGLSVTRVEKAAALDNAAAVVRHHGRALVTVRAARQEPALEPLAGPGCIHFP
jgi:hypothetical protein